MLVCAINMVLQKFKLGRTSKHNNDDKKKNLKDSIKDEGKDDEKIYKYFLTYCIKHHLFEYIIDNL